MQNKNKGVLIITEYFYPEEFGINDLALEWKDKGYSVYVLTQSPNYPYDKIYDGYKNRLFQKNVWNNIVIYSVFTLLGYQKSVLRKIIHYLVFAIISSIACLFIHRKISKVFVYQVGPLTQIIPGLVLKKLFGKSLFLWVLDLWPDTVFAYGIKRRRWSETILRYFVKTSYNLCNHIFVSNDGFKKRIKQYSQKAEITFAPQWVPKDLNFKDSKPKEDLDGYFNFTFAGNIGKVQNLENIIKGFGQAEIKNNVRLNIIGDGSNLKTLQQLVLHDNINNVIFWGRQPLIEMPMWLLGSDVLIISLIDKPNFALT
ncbi:glycosyltransferase family 4 protein, partial [Bacteroidota bacterium]